MCLIEIGISNVKVRGLLHFRKYDSFAYLICRCYQQTVHLLTTYFNFIKGLNINCRNFNWNFIRDSCNQKDHLLDPVWSQRADFIIGNQFLWRKLTFSDHRNDWLTSPYTFFNIISLCLSNNCLPLFLFSKS